MAKHLVHCGRHVAAQACATSPGIMAPRHDREREDPAISNANCTQTPRHTELAPNCQRVSFTYRLAPLRDEACQCAGQHERIQLGNMTRGSPCLIAHGPFKIGNDCNRVLPPTSSMANCGGTSSPQKQDSGQVPAQAKTRPGLVRYLDKTWIITIWLLKVRHNITYPAEAGDIRSRGLSARRTLWRTVTRRSSPLPVLQYPTYPDPPTIKAATCPTKGAHRNLDWVAVSRLLGRPQVRRAVDGPIFDGSSGRVGLVI